MIKSIISSGHEGFAAAFAGVVVKTAAPVFKVGGKEWLPVPDIDQGFFKPDPAYCSL